jgi:hypothetical protein
MKRIFSNPVFALATGLCLRLFFVLKFPANSGDTLLYEQIATNWLKHHVYAMEVHGAITPVDLRMPGYPAFLALIYALTGRTGEAARLLVMLAQVAIDLLSCILIAAFASLFLCMLNPPKNRGTIFRASLWLAAACPFTANYTAVPLTETLAVFFTVASLIVFVIQMQSEGGLNITRAEGFFHAKGGPELFGVVAGILVGIGSLFRPETALLLVAAWLVLGWKLGVKGDWRSWVRVILSSSLAAAVPLFPWAVRNAVTLHEVQFLAQKYSNLPGELVPYGFMAWERTWLYRMRDCYLVPWKLNEEPIDVDTIPARVFDSPEEKQRVAAILEKYNDDLTLTKEEDDAFGQIARERTARHPLRTYLSVPVKRAVVMWFTPRIELLPVAGHVFPLAYMREEDPVDQEVTSGFFLLNLVYVGLGIWGAVTLCRSSPSIRPAVVFLTLFILLRTAFLTTLETPEPRYVLVCFPALIALGVQVFARQPDNA